MSDLDRIITYTFRMQDNVSSSLKNMRESASQTDKRLQSLLTSADDVKEQVQSISGVLKGTDVSAQATALNGLAESAQRAGDAVGSIGTADVSDGIEAQERLQEAIRTTADMMDVSEGIEAQEQLRTAISGTTELLDTQTDAVRDSLRSMEGVRDTITGTTDLLDAQTYVARDSLREVSDAQDSVRMMLTDTEGIEAQEQLRTTITGTTELLAVQSATADTTAEDVMSSQDAIRQMLTNMDGITKDLEDGIRSMSEDIKEGQTVTTETVEDLIRLRTVIEYNDGVIQGMLESETSLDEETARIADTVRLRNQSMIEDIDSAVEEAKASLQELDADMERSQINVLTQLAGLTALRGSVSAVTGGLRGLGLVGDETAESLQKINGAFALFSGAVTAIKSVQAVMTTLNASTALYATITTYLQALKNPLAIGAIAAAGLTAGGVAGYLLGSQGDTTNNNTTTNNFYNESPGSQAVAQEIYLMGALK